MSEGFALVQSAALVLPQEDVDTDIIFPARFLLITDKAGLGRYAFYEWRYDAKGRPLPGSPLAPERLQDKQILLAGANFGSGSSREHAPWALKDLGFKVIIAPSFAEIFRSNCFKNGMLPIILPPPSVQQLMEEADAGETLTVDLLARQVRSSAGATHVFEVEDWRREALINGWDEIEIIRNQYGQDIARFEQAQAQQMPWLWSKKELSDG